jgi:folate-binding protein YgfZ
LPDAQTTMTNATSDIKEANNGCIDPRAPSLGRRALLPPNASQELYPDIPTVPEQAYTIHRYLQGVPEGPLEIVPNTALPAESNMDIMSGIDFRKGCYLGQELTIRTHHTGVVRKRILPVQLYSEGSPTPSSLSYSPSQSYDIPGGLNITRSNRKGRPAGKTLTSVGNIGLALCRLEIMTDVILTAEGGSWKEGDEFAVETDGSAGDKTMVQAFIPSWHGRLSDGVAAGRQVEG